MIIIKQNFKLFITIIIKVNNLIKLTNGKIKQYN